MLEKSRQRIYPCANTIREAIMWAESGNKLNMKTLWTYTPYAMQRVAGLFEANEITTADRDDLTHFIEHGWLVWRGAIAPDLIDQFTADIRGHHKHPGKFLTTSHRDNKPNLKLSGTSPDHF